MPSFQGSIRSTGPRSAKATFTILLKTYTVIINYTPNVETWSCSNATLSFDIIDEPEGIPYSGTIGKTSINLHSPFHNAKLTGELDSPISQEYFIYGGLVLPGRPAGAEVKEA